MKKLMVIAAVAMAVFASNAATMKWGTGAMKNALGSTATAANMTSTMYVLSASEYTAFTTAIAGMSADDFNSYVYNTYKDASGVKPGAFSKGAATFTDPATYGKDDTAYAVFLYTTVNGDDVYAMANHGSWFFESDVTKTMAGMGTKLEGTGAATSWTLQAVPEPTSGLLLLLGMAGLALKRKHA